MLRTSPPKTPAPLLAASGLEEELSTSIPREPPSFLSCWTVPSTNLFFLLGAWIPGLGGVADSVGERGCLGDCEDLDEMNELSAAFLLKPGDVAGSCEPDRRWWPTPKTAPTPPRAAPAPPTATPATSFPPPYTTPVTVFPPPYAAPATDLPMSPTMPDVACQAFLVARFSRCLLVNFMRSASSSSSSSDSPMELRREGA